MVELGGVGAGAGRGEDQPGAAVATEVPDLIGLGKGEAER